MSEQINLEMELTPIDPEAEKYRSMLSNLQGNILKPHGRNKAVILFLHFSEEPEKIEKTRVWISDFASQNLTSALEQFHEARKFRVEKIPGGVFGGFYLSKSGYLKLGFSREELNKFYEENLRDEEQPPDAGIPTNINVSFKDGMEAAGRALRDLPRSLWEKDFQVYPPDAMVLLADDNEDNLKNAAERAVENLRDLQIDFFRQDGSVVRDEENNPVEPFGFRDGISQPLFYQSDVDKESGSQNWKSFAPLKLVLVKDPLIKQENCFGSYLVYRKLEQDVERFKQAEEILYKILKLPEDKRTVIEALIVGRFRNGIPLASTSDENAVGLAGSNDFDFRDLESKRFVANKCPYHAHIRRMNPRGEADHVEEAEKEKMRRIVRRGITYEEIAEENGDTVRKVGLLFMCFQKSIPKQFGFIQTKWANTSAFLGNTSGGLDPIAGRNDSIKPKALERQHTWHPVWGSDENPASFEFESFVTLKGGEFFFAPSIPFLLSLVKKGH